MPLVGHLEKYELMQKSKLYVLLFLILPGFTAHSMFQPIDTTRRALVKDTVITQKEYTSSTEAGSSASSGIINLAAPLSAGASIITSSLNNYVRKFTANYWQENRAHLQAIQSKSGPYFRVIDQVFSRYGIPKELRYLAVIESELNPNAVSKVGAVGLWQLMAGTARLLGLTVNRHRDDRRNVYKSTVAAAKYLKDLHHTFNDWLLVVAAYNCGPAAVMNAIEQSGSNNFFDLEKYLPSETQSHVMRFLATAYTLGRLSSFFGLDETNADQDIPMSSTNRLSTADIQSIPLNGKYALPVIAQYLQMDVNALKRLNPEWEKPPSNGQIMLNLPADKVAIFKSYQQTILNESQKLFLENNKLEATTKTPANKDNKWTYHHSHKRGSTSTIQHHPVVSPRKKSSIHKKAS
ncbi:MAG: lytic transglycosylase domain-containing protein [Thermoflavifilum sp.]|nr:lytic transglycosylase domain-containing protein [Thermoflavifilum sp.]